MKKNTNELLQELNGSSDVCDFVEQHKNDFVNLSVSQYLNNMIEQKQLSKSEVFKNAEMNDIYGYQIFSGVRIPSRDKFISLCIGMKLTLEETQAGLKAAGFAALYPKHKRDCFIIKGIDDNKTVFELNQLLFESNEETL